MILLAWCAVSCARAPTQQAPAPQATSVGAHAPDAAADASAVGSAAARSHTPKARTWRLREDSPFTLVAEDLKDADVATLGGTPILYSAACDGKRTAPDASPGSYVLRAVAGDHFLPPLAASPAVAGAHGGVTLLGRWPDAVWLRFSEQGEEKPAARYLLFNWDGHQWQPFPTSTGPKGLIPLDVFAWADGSQLVTQIQRWHYSVSYRVAPFLLWGRSSRAVPDLSTLPFPSDPRHDQQLAAVEYAALPTHELFALRRLWTHDDTHSWIYVGYSTQSGALVLDKVVDAAGSSDARLATGRLGDRDVVVAWGTLRQGGRPYPWLKRYDGLSSAQLPLPAPGATQADLDDVWLAGGKLWARRAGLSEVWAFDGTSWSLFAHVQPGMGLAWAVADGSLWGTFGPEVVRFEADGRRVSVPFLGESTRDLHAAYHVVVTAPDDIWLIAAAQDEQLVFRTRKMTSILACD